jgi:hypothetical protein
MGTAINGHEFHQGTPGILAEFVAWFSFGSKYLPAKPVALACEPLKADREAFSESASESEVAIGF